MYFEIHSLIIYIYNKFTFVWHYFPLIAGHSLDQSLNTAHIIQTMAVIAEACILSFIASVDVFY